MRIQKRNTIILSKITPVFLLLLFCILPTMAQTREGKIALAGKTFVEAKNLLNQQTLESNQAARKKFLEASRLFQEGGERGAEAISLVWAGIISDNLGEKQIALGYYNQALLIFQILSDNTWTALTLSNIGAVYSSLGEKKKALEYQNQSLLITRAFKDTHGEAKALNNIGAVYYDLGELKKALEYYGQALPLLRQVGNKHGESGTLGNIGTVYAALGEKKKALEYHNQSLLISRSIGDKHGEAVTLINMGEVYSDLAEKQKALEYYYQALPILRTIGDKHAEAKILNLIGLVYFNLGEKQKAFEFYGQSLLLYRAVGDKHGEAATLNNLGMLGDKEQSLKFYNQALSLLQSIGDKRGEAQTLSNIGTVYDELGEKQKALEYYNQSLILCRTVGDKAGEFHALNNIGAAYFDLEDKSQALKFFNLALPLVRAIGDKNGEARTLNNLMYLWKSQNNGRLAILYGKQSINIFQQFRANVQMLDKEVQRSFLKSIEPFYRKLSDTLIAENRLPEAQQVLNSFKDQQFFDFDQTQTKQSVMLVLSPRETDFFASYEKTSDRVGTIGGQVEELKRQIGNRQPRAEEKTQIQKLEGDLKIATDEFLAVLKKAETEFSKPLDEKDKVGEIPDLPLMQTALREISANTKQKAAAVYQVVGEENFHVLVITADDIKSVSTPFKNSDLNQKALDFWALLQSPVYDPNLVGKELYDVVFKPLESVLPKDTKTILWALDGNLRYVPMAALFDGKQYLAEKYNHVNFTRADKERMTRTVKPVWTATGLGTSEEKTVELLGSRISFDALPGVGEEFKLLFKPKTGSGGIFSGDTFQNAAFNKKTMLDALKQKRPLVHIASHFSFRAGDEARSFLLLGDGTAFTLEEMKREPNLFEGVDLLTLSACNTAAQQSGANGREIDGFAELAQRLGANSVMATLWSVADCTTPWLMREFYDSKLNKNKNKAESLREAQLGLISGKAEIKTCPTRTDLSPIKIELVENETERKKQPTRSGVYYLDKKNAPLWDKEKHPPFAHPFYWSPFILFGNWK